MKKVLNTVVSIETISIIVYRHFEDQVKLLYNIDVTYDVSRIAR